VLSVIEDFGSIGLTVLALAVPVLAALALAGIVVALVLALRRMRRATRARSPA